MAYKDKNNQKEYNHTYSQTHKLKRSQYNQSHKLEQIEYRKAHREEMIIYHREYYQVNKTERAEKGKEYYKSHRGQIKEYCETHKVEKATYQKEYRRTHDLEKREYAHKRVLQTKVEILSHYGNGKLVCVRCGHDDIRALSIDHINGGGCKHRRDDHIDSGVGFYAWLKKNNFPEGFQTLCMNCQWVKREENREYTKSIPKDTVMVGAKL